MISALVQSSYGPDAPKLTEDLIAVGIAALEIHDCIDLMQHVIKNAPDVIVCFDQSPDADFFARFDAIRRTAPRPVLVFTPDPDADKIALATGSGVHAYVVGGYSRLRLRSMVHLAQARFREEQTLRKELADLQRRFDERKLVDRAKGILMGAHHLREDEAYRALRNAAMDSKQRIGQLSQLVIDTARYAEAVNRAGQLRMLSQRLVKLYALACVQVRPAQTKALFTESLAQIETILAALGRSMSQPTFGDLLKAVTDPWTRLRMVLAAPPHLDRLQEVDALAETLLDHAERLTTNLEIATFANALHAINIAGRQRMLSQRLAKQSLMLALLPPDKAPSITAAGSQTEAELEAGLVFLNALPLSNDAITQELAQTARAWDGFKNALAARESQPGRERIADTSETLLGHFDRLTDMLERAIQVFSGQASSGPSAARPG